GGFAGRPGGFQRLNVNGRAQEQDQQQDETAQDPAPPVNPGAVNAGNDQPLGQAASSDAFLMSGTVGRGADSGAGGPFFMPTPDIGNVGVGPGGPGGGGLGGGGGFPGGAPGGGGRGIPGGAVVVARPAGPAPQRGGRGPGRGAPPQGIEALWGMARVMRQRANQVHASLYDQYSNSAFNARPYSLNQANPPKIAAWNERFGGNLGGPLRPPHVYNGTNRTFFFVNFDGTWARNAVDQFSTVPTLAERGGDFSDRGISLYAPNSNQLLNPSNPSAIPAGTLNPASLGLLQFIPAPNLPGLVNNFHLQSVVPTQQDRLNTRILHTISSKLNARVVYNFSQSDNHAFQFFPSFESNLGTRGQAATVGLTQNWSRTWINDSQFVFSRNRVQTLNQFAYVDNVTGALGINGVSTSPIDYGVPQLSFTNYTHVSDAIPSLTRNQTFRFVDGV